MAWQIHLEEEFQSSDWALLFYSRFKNFRGKLTTRWMCPYEIEEVFGNDAIKLKTIDEQPTSFKVNGHRLRLYHKPTSREEFTHQVQQQSNMEWVEGGTLPFEELSKKHL